MKKNIVFIVDGFYPNYSAVGVCINNVVQELSDQYNIIIITKKLRSDAQNELINNVNIHRYDTTENNLRNIINERIDSSFGLNSIFFKTASLVVRGYGYIRAILKKSNINNQQVENIYNELTKIDKKIDVIIPACLPFEGIISAIKFKNDNMNSIKVIPFLFDKFSANSTLHRTVRNRNRKFKAHISLEREMFDKCEALLFVESWNKHLHENIYDCRSKFIQVEHPLLKHVTSSENILYNSDSINIVYTGALYKKIRSPLGALKLFSKLIDLDKRLTLHFYITGDCDSIVNSYAKKYPYNIINHGCVKTDTAKSAIINADILLSIGNSDISQLPSKIFEYISTGNPIIHLYFSEHDPTLTILNRYKNSYCISNDIYLSMQTNLMILKRIYTWGDRLTFDEIEKIYRIATPNYIAKKIINLI